MQRKPGSTRSRVMTRGAYSAHSALTRLEREHVALLKALCDLEAPTTQAGGLSTSSEVRQALHALLREDLQRTQHALHLAARGLFGCCEECHRTLPRRHLELKPASTHCPVCEARAHRVVYSNA